MRPLEGVFVLDFSTLLPGPMATLLLAEAGAEVVKVERPGSGEEMRSYAPKWGRDSVNFALLNRGKKSIALDLKDAHERTRLRPLVERADVIVEQFRPGVMARLGLDYDTVAAINAQAIYCSITGYGQTGPKRDSAGHDLNFIGDAGLLALSIGKVADPVVPPALIADIAGGAYPAVINILLALRERQQSGRGRRLDISMTDNLFPFMYWAIGSGLAAGQWPGNGAALVTGGTPRYRLYGTRDGKVVAAAPIEQKFWDIFCDIVGLDGELRNDAANPAATVAQVVRIIAADDAAVWALRFAGKDCCCSVVATIQQAMDDPHFRARGLFDHVLANEGELRIPALPVPVDSAFRAPPVTAIAAPALGVHNEDYLR
jgi:crotonobetainyl-CoA:carnitine CoA-transferase CaiB-like acyl-CoA transferase